MFSSHKVVHSIIIALCFSLILPLRLQAEYTQLKLTTELQDLSDLTLRAIIHYHTVKAFCILENEQLASFGFSTPFSAIGPLVQSGLLREIMNPLAYTATSSVFSEKTDLRLTTALDGSSYWGLALRPLPNNCMVYYLGKKAKPFAIGSVIRLEWDRFLLFESLIATSEPPAQQVSDVWFEDKPIFAGGRLVHISPRFKFTWSNLSCIISGSLSCGSLVIPGYFLHVVCGLNSDLVQTALILGYLSKDYVNPYGEYNDKNILYGGTISLTPCSWLKLEQEYKRIIFHRQPLYDQYRKCKEKLSSSLEITVALAETSMLYLNEEYYVSFYFFPDNEDYCTHKVKSAVALEIDSCKLTAELRLDHIGLEDQSLVTICKLEMLIQLVTAKISVERCETERKTSYSAALSLFLKLGNHKLYIKMSTKKALRADDITWQDLGASLSRYVSLTLGWEGVW